LSIKPLHCPARHVRTPFENTVVAVERRSRHWASKNPPGRFADPAIGQRLPITGNASQFGAMLALETERWRKVVELSGQKKE
jgi:hypothetical protein